MTLAEPRESIAGCRHHGEEICSSRLPAVLGALASDVVAQGVCADCAQEVAVGAKNSLAGKNDCD
jgi:hypothetical protein